MSLRRTIISNIGVCTSESKMLPDIMQAMPQISTHFMFCGFLTR